MTSDESIDWEEVARQADAAQATSQSSALPAAPAAAAEEGASAASSQRRSAAAAAPAAARSLAPAAVPPVAPALADACANMMGARNRASRLQAATTKWKKVISDLKAKYKRPPGSRGGTAYNKADAALLKEAKANLHALQSGGGRRGAGGPVRRRARRLSCRAARRSPCRAGGPSARAPKDGIRSCGGGSAAATAPGGGCGPKGGYGCGCGRRRR